jgi:hypothetical protein
MVVVVLLEIKEEKVSAELASAKVSEESSSPESMAVGSSPLPLLPSLLIVSVLD